MIALVLAAGLGTRLKPWTLSHPKALVPVGGIPMLRRVLERLVSQDFDTVIVNVHHFASQICDYLADNDFGANIIISDETGQLLDTGGAVVRASALDVRLKSEPLLVHNVDILSNADLKALMCKSIDDEADASLLVSNRDSSRKLIFDNSFALRGWHNTATGEFRPQMPGNWMHDTQSGAIKYQEFAFSGIYVVSPRATAMMREVYGDAPFPVMDFFLSLQDRMTFRGVVDEKLQLIDIGKPETLELANSLFE